MKTRKAIAVAAAAALALTMSPAALAAGEEAPSKEEVVYINLDASGAVDTVDVVNIFDVAQAGQIVDHGAYQSVRNMTDMAPVELDGQTVTIDAQPGRLYYEGRLPEAEMPWTVTLRYFLDGEETDPADIAGQSGALEIRMTVEENPACEGDYFDNYALQATFTLDEALCRDIQAPGATVANVGGDKQLTYTILPGQGADISLRAQVTDFSMDEVALNGVPLVLDVQVDETDLTGRIGELLEAVAALDDGAGQLSEGLDELSGGAEELLAGAAAVRDGAEDLTAGAEELAEGAGQVADGAAQASGGAAVLSGQSSSLTDASAALKAGLEALQASLTGDGSVGGMGDIAGSSAAIRQGVDALAAGAAQLQSGAAAMTALPEQYGAAASALAGAAEKVEDPAVRAELEAIGASLQGLNGLLSGALGESGGADLLGAVDSLAASAAQLQQSYAAFDDAIQSASASPETLLGMLTQLRTAAAELSGGAAALDTGLQQYTQGVAGLAVSLGTLQEGADSAAQGAAALADGAAALESGASDEADGAETLSGAVSDLAEGAGTLKEGSAALREETDGMDGELEESVGDLLRSLTGGAGKPVSFASAENGTVSAVQFVIRTPAIRPTAEETPAPEPTAEPGFWQRLKDLF